MPTSFVSSPLSCHCPLRTRPPPPRRLYTQPGAVSSFPQIPLKVLHKTEERGGNLTGHKSSSELKLDIFIFLPTIGKHFRIVHITMQCCCKWSVDKGVNEEKQAPSLNNVQPRYSSLHNWTHRPVRWTQW